MAEGTDRQMAQGAADLKTSVNRSMPDHNAGIVAALHKANQAQVKLSQARGKAYAAARPVAIQDASGRWTMMPHSHAEHHVKSAKKQNPRKRVAGKQ